MWTVHASREPVLYNMTDLPYYSGLTQTFLGFSLVYHKHTEKNVCLPLATSTVLSIYHIHYTKVTNWRAVLSYFISRMPQPHPTKNESKMTQSICATMICAVNQSRTLNRQPYTRDHRLLHVHEHLSTSRDYSLKLVLIQMAKSEVCLHNVTYI